MDIKYGEFKYIGKHKGCKYGGKLMLCSPHIINGKKHPPNSPDEWHWCNGLRYHKDQFTMQKELRRCGYSSRDEVKEENKELHD